MNNTGDILLEETDSLVLVGKEVKAETESEDLLVKKDGRWYRQSTFFATLFQVVDDDDGPDSTYEQLFDEKMSNQAKGIGRKMQAPSSSKRPPTASKRPAPAAENSSHNSKKPARDSSEDKASSSEGKTSASFTDAPFPTAENELDSRPLIVIADYLQDISIEDELRAKRPELFNTLMAGLKGRQEVMQPKGALKFEFINYGKKTVKQRAAMLTQRNECRDSRITGISDSTMINLEKEARRDDLAVELKKRQKFQGPMPQQPLNLADRPHPSTSATAFDPSYPGYFEIDQLIEYAERKGLVVLNIDRFATATNNRTVHFNAEGKCAHCAVHGRVSQRPHDICPFIFCACAQCYVVDKLRS